MTRARKGSTVRERREETARRAGEAHSALIDSAFANAGFRALYRTAVRAVLESPSEDALASAIERALGDLRRFVASEDYELAQEVLAQQIVYEAARQADQTHEDALARVRAVRDVVARAPRLQARRYRIAVGNPTTFDQRGTMHIPLLRSAQRHEVRRLEEDVLAERPRRGRPVGLDKPCEEFRADYLRVVADLKSALRARSRENIATHMELTVRQLGRYLERCGDPG